MFHPYARPAGPRHPYPYGSPYMARAPPRMWAHGPPPPLAMPAAAPAAAAGPSGMPPMPVPPIAMRRMPRMPPPPGYWAPYPPPHHMGPVTPRPYFAAAAGAPPPPGPGAWPAACGKDDALMVGDAAAGAAPAGPSPHKGMARMYYPAPSPPAGCAGPGGSSPRSAVYGLVPPLMGPPTPRGAPQYPVRYAPGCALPGAAAAAGGMVHPPHRFADAVLPHAPAAAAFPGFASPGCRSSGAWAPPSYPECQPHHHQHALARYDGGGGDDDAYGDAVLAEFSTCCIASSAEPGDACKPGVAHTLEQHAGGPLDEQDWCAGISFDEAGTA